MWIDILIFYASSRWALAKSEVSKVGSKYMVTYSKLMRQAFRGGIQERWIRVNNRSHEFDF